MSDVENTQGRRKPWVLTVCGALLVLVLLAMPFLAGEPGEKELPDWVRFIGHFHPVVLHLPIGVFMLILIQETWRLIRFKRPGTDGDSLFPLFFGCVSAVVAVIAGFMLYHGHGAEYAMEEDGPAERHLWGGLVFACLTIVVFLTKLWAISDGSRGWCYRVLLFLTVGIMGFTSHDGASMTHGEDYLTKYAPDPVRQALGLEPKAKDRDDAPEEAFDPVVYTDLVMPILERKCVQCHKPGKVKGKLRMDTFEMLIKGGSEGPALVAGNADESLMIQRIELPEDDDEHMPPEGKTDITAQELVVLRWWIDQGADAGKRLSEVEAGPEVKEALAALGASVSESAGESAAAPAKSKGPDSALVQLVAGFSKDFPGAVALESQSSAGVTFTAVSLRSKMDDAMFSKLAPLTPHFVTVDLTASQVTDQSVSLLKSAGMLRQLRLAETPVSDASMDVIASLPSLESLNLYGTSVTDAGAEKLKAMKQLKALYLWQTKVSPEMIEALRAALPECRIVTGVDS